MSKKNFKKAETLAEMKAQVSGKKLPKKTEKKVVEKAAKKKALPTVSTQGKKAVDKKPRKQKVSYEAAERLIAEILEIKLKEEEMNGKLVKKGAKGSISILSMPARGELKLKYNGKVLCEIYPVAQGYNFCTKVASLLKLPKDTNVEQHPKWDMYEKFNVSVEHLGSVLNQYAKLTVVKVA